MTYTAKNLCGEGIVVVPSLVAILVKGFVVAFFGKRLVVALFDGCILLGVLTIIVLGNVHAVFSVLKGLAFGNLHPLAMYTLSLVYSLHSISVYLRRWLLHGTV
jgi:hypothetical protein